MTLKGAKGGGSSSFKQRPDNLRSNDTFEGLLVICAGPIVGPVNGLKSQKINGTPIEDASGTSNFQGVTMVTADGDPAKFPQIATLKLGTGASPVSVNLSVGNTNGAGTPGPWVVKTINNTGADSLDLRFIVNQLVRQDKAGIYEATANLEIQMKPIGATVWINPNLSVPSGAYSSSGFSFIGRGGSDLRGYVPEEYYTSDNTAWLPETNSGYIAITGKTASPYVLELRIDVPNEGSYANKGWDVRVRLREVESLDADPNYEKRLISWESIAAVYAKDVGNHEDWRGVAWAQVYGKATDQFNGAPEIEGDFFTKIVSVPPATVFNPTTRQYTAVTWDGSYSKSYTNDPAWVINDALSDSLFGLSNLAPGSRLNKWDALEISKYCSQLVSDGAAGTHPRFSMNLKVTEPQKADEFIQYLAGAISGFAWDDGGGEWRMKQDKPETPSDILTLETIEGEFSYSHSDIDSRFNDITMTFLNEEMDFREDRVRVFDQPHITKYGRKPMTVVAVGCTHRQEALRRATLRLRSSINEYRMVNYTLNRRGRLVQPFDTVLIADGDLGYKLPTGISVANPADSDGTNNRTTGRMLSMDGTRMQLTLRDTVRLEIGVTYNVYFSIPNPDYNPNPSSEPLISSWHMPTITISRTLTNTSGQRGDVTTLYLNAALPTTMPEFANFALEAAGLPAIPKTYRILEVKANEDGERISITAVEVDTAKYAIADAAVESTFSYSAPDIIVPPPLAPVSGGLISLVQIPGSGADRVNLVVNWQRPASLYLNGFTVRYSVNNGPAIDAVVGLQDTTWEMVDPAAGTYTFEIYSRDRRDVMSLPLKGSFVVTSGMLGAFADIASDNLLTPDEKPRVILERDVILAEQSGIGARATAYGITTEKTAYDSSITSLTSYLATLTAPVLWSTLTGNTTIVGTTFRTTFANVYAARQTLLNKIDEIAGQQALWASVTGAGRPADNATRNVNQGTWSSASVVYALGDFVQLSGSSYSVTTAHTSTAGNGPPGANWTLLASQGTNGTSGLNAAVVFLYLRSASAPAVPSVTSTYTFSTGVLTGQNNSWTQTVPASNGQPLYITTATASSTAATDTIPNTEWAAPTILAQDGTSGTSGLNTATVFLYRRSLSVPALPSVSTTYTFATAVLTGQNNSWVQGVPAGTDPLYVTTAAAVNVAATDTIANTEWSAATVLAQNGTDGTNGLNSAVVFLYLRSASLPSVPSVSSTYTFSTGALTGQNNSWTQSVPASNGQPLYVTTATASSTAATDTIANTEWAAPTILVQDGTSGTSGLNSAVVFLYRRSASVPALPSVSSTYTFSSGVLTGQNNSWVQSVPAGTDPLYVTTAAAVGAGTTDTILSTDWSATNIIAQNGTNGNNGVSAISGYLTSEAVQLASFANGGVTNYSTATGTFKIFSGATDVSASFALSTVANPQVLTVGYVGQTYSVTAGFDDGEDTASLTIRATGSGAYVGITLDKVFSLSKAKGGYEIVATLPVANLFEGRVVFLTTDDKLYRYTGAAWTSAVPAADISGQLADAQLAALAASKVTGQLTNVQLADLASTKITGTLTDAQLSAIASTKITGTLTDAQLSAIASTKITGTLTDAQLSAIASTKITGTLTNAQLAAIDAAKVTGQLADSQIAAVSITKVSGGVGGGNLLYNSSFKYVTGTINTNGSMPASWGTYNNGGISVTTQAVSGGLFGTNFYRVTANAATTSTLGVYISGVTTPGSVWLPGVDHMISFWARAGNAAAVGYSMTGLNSNMGFSTATAISQPNLVQTTWQRYVWRVQPNQNANTASGELFTSWTGGNGTFPSGGILEICAIQVEQGSLVSAYAPRPDEILPNTITSTEIATDAITSPKIVAGAIVAGKIAADVITANEIAAGTITASEIAANTITANEIAANAITTSELSAGAVTAGKIAAGSIVTGDIAADTITAGNIAANAITASELAAGSVVAGKIAADAVTANEIAANSITASELAAGAVTAGKIAAGSIVAGDIAANTITASQIAASTITSGQIAADTITAGNIAANAITASELAAGSVVAGKIAADAVTANEIAANAITASEISAGAVTAGKIAALSITAGDIAALTITAGQIAASTITGAKIAAGTIAAGNIVSNTITASQIAASTITATEIATNAVTADKVNAGAITAAKLSVSSLDAITGTIGLLRTATTGARTELESNQMRVYDASNVLRVRIGVWA